MPAKPSPHGGIWAEILDQAARAAQIPNSHVLLLGRRDVGKSSMLHTLQKIGHGQGKIQDVELLQDNDGVSAVDYAYISVRNEEDGYGAATDSLAKMNVWIVQYAVHRDILLSQFKSQFLKNSAVVICLDLSEPWSLRDELVNWLEFVVDVLGQLVRELSVDEQESLRYKLAHYIQTYRSSVEMETAGDFAKRQIEVAEDASPDDSGNKLSINLGVPILVCVCKSDFVHALDTRNCQGHIDVVEAHLRQICLTYGASLIFFSGKEDINGRNNELLYRYLMHRVHGFDFKEKAIETPKESLFYPSGWDSAEAVRKFVKTTIAAGFDTPYSAIITRTDSARVAPAGVRPETNGHMETTNEFLMDVLEKLPYALCATAASTSGPPAAVHSQTARQRRSPSRESETRRGDSIPDASRLPTGKRLSDPVNTAKQGDSLRSFFHTLLAKGQKPSPRRTGSNSSADGAPTMAATARQLTTPDNITSTPSTTSSQQAAATTLSHPVP